MSADAAHQLVRRARQGGGEDGNSGDQQSRASVFSINTPEELVQFYRTEVGRLREDVNAPPSQLVTALLQLGIALADHPDLGDAEPPLREARERMDADDSASYSVESLVFVQVLASVLQSRDNFDAADDLYTAALANTQRARGREHPWTLELQNNLGCLRTAAGIWHIARGQVDKAKHYFDGAEVLFKKSHNAKVHVFGQLHRTTLKTRCNVSMASFHRGDASGLEMDLLAASQALKTSYGSEDPDVKHVANHLTSIYRRVGNYGRAVELSVEFGVDPPEDYEIRPFKDTIIPGLPTSRGSTGQILNAGVDKEQFPVEILRTVLDITYPKWGLYTVRALTRTRNMIRNWTGMDVDTFLEALGFPGLAHWGVVTRREVLLEQAAAVGHYSAVELLLQKMRGGATSKNLENEEAVLTRAFHLAVQSGSRGVVRLFLDYGVKPVATDDAGKSALHKAAELGLEAVLMELVQGVDDVDLRDGDGDTALDLALRENHEGIIRFLMSKKGALLASSKSTVKDTDTKPRGNDPEIGVFNVSLYTGLNATVVNFYVDPTHEVEEHRVWVEPVEAVVSDSNLLRSMLNDDGRTDEEPDFTWIHIPANNMFWVETLMKNLAEVGEDRERYLNLITTEVWHNQLHESLHGSVHGRFMNPYCGKVGGTSHKSDIVLYMPYLHWESEPMKKEMDEAIDKIERNLKYNIKNVKELLKRHIPHRNGDDESMGDKPGDDKDGSDAGASPDSRLLQTYLYLPGAAPLHVRRTFDQFQYYMNDDTAARDSDQVISRYFQRRYKSLTVPIMMVDQLWMWIIGQGTIVTCFPKSWGEVGAAKEETGQILDTGNVLDIVLERLNLKFREPILSVYELADVIMARCLGLHSDNRQWENERHRYLEIFEHSINYVADEEIRRFNYFADGGRTGAKARRRKSKEAKEGAKTIKDRKLKEQLALEALTSVFDHDVAKAIMDREISSTRRWGIEEKDMEEIFDISNEIELLKEIKDIQDELNILRTLFAQQSRVVKSYHRVSGERIRSSEMVDAVARLSTIVEKMDIDAQRPYKALEDLLDLKQKQANVAEARITRQSGTTITVFTVVTIVFLPASFMAAFFALPIAEYPFVDGLFPIHYAVKWTVSVTVAVATPLIIVALYVNPILACLRLQGRVAQGIAKAAAKITKAIFKATKMIVKSTVELLPLLWWLSLLVCLRLGSIVQWLRDYRAAKKETVAKGEEWSKRRYVLGGLLQRRLEKRKVMDEEEQNRERRRSGSRPRSSMTSRSASFVESSNDSQT